MSPNPPEIRSLNVTRYVTPLREGGSLPAIVEADDGFRYVLKFRGAGQGTNALVAELLGGAIARTIGESSPFSSRDLHRQAYVEYFESRVLNSNLFVKEALDARDTLI